MSKHQGSRKVIKDSEGTRDIPEFIQKLFKMLETKAFRDTFCWSPDGASFMVKDTNEFSRVILPKHFKHCNFASFVRQLNKYDFHKVRNADDPRKQPGNGHAWEFVHPKFKRDRRDLLDEIRRKTPSKRDKSADNTVFEHSASGQGISGNSNTSSTAMNSIPSSMDTVEFVTMEAPVAVSGSNMDRSADSFSGFAQLASGLQEQIEYLKRSHAEMEAKLHNLGQADKLIRKELADVNQNLAAKDAWIQELLKTTSDGGSSKTWPPGTSIQQAPAETSVPELPASDTTAVAAAAAASMNAGSLIGSPFKTHDGLGFVTLGRVAASKTSSNDSRVSIEITSSPTGSLIPQNRQLNGNKTPQDGWTVAPRVLLVDDDSVYRNLSKELLKKMGCKIYLAKDGMEALRQMGLEKYDLILMDIVMPNLDGISATRNIRQYDALTPIISMTSNFSDSDIMQYIGSGMTDILPKPFSKKTLYSILEKYCAHLKTIQGVHGAYFPAGFSITPALPLPSPNTTYTTTNDTTSNNDTNNVSGGSGSSSSTTSISTSTGSNSETTAAMTLPFFSPSPVFINHFDNNVQSWPQQGLPPRTQNEGSVVRSSIIVGDDAKFMWTAAPPIPQSTASISSTNSTPTPTTTTTASIDKDDMHCQKRLKLEH